MDIKLPQRCTRAPNGYIYLEYGALLYPQVPSESSLSGNKSLNSTDISRTALPSMVIRNAAFHRAVEEIPCIELLQARKGLGH